jgi:hypothetical protein
MNDAEFMRIAIEESKNGDWPKGAVIVKDGAIGGNEPWTTRGSAKCMRNSTRHCGW